MIEHRTLDSQQIEAFKTRNNLKRGVIAAVKEVRFGTPENGIAPFVLVVCENGAGAPATPERD